MPWSAVPDHLNPKINPDAWKGTDQDVWYLRWWKIKIKGWFAFGPNAKESWARFREYPITLFAWFGPYFSRWESSRGLDQVPYKSGFWFYQNSAREGLYLSRIQVWSRAHVQLQYPLYFAFHVFWREKDVMVYPDTNTDHLDITKYFGAGFGFKRDGDRVYWLTAHAGGRPE